MMFKMPNINLMGFAKDKFQKDFIIYEKILNNNIDDDVREWAQENYDNCKQILKEIK